MSALAELLGSVLPQQSLESQLFGPNSLQHQLAAIHPLVSEHALLMQRRRELNESLRSELIPSDPLWTDGDYEACLAAGYVPPDLRLWRLREDAKAYEAWQARKTELDAWLAAKSVAERAHVRHVLETQY